jgi:hypothetical protein
VRFLAPPNSSSFPLPEYLGGQRPPCPFPAFAWLSHCKLRLLTDLNHVVIPSAVR